MRPVSLLIVDDSATLRAVVKSVVRKDPGIEVVGEAANAIEARHLIKELNPDVITLDIEMPGMNGLDFLEKIMTLRPMPVIMLSSSTSAGSESAITALASGAFHCLAKPSTGNIIEALSELCDLIKAAAQSPIGKNRASANSSAAQAPASTPSSTTEAPAKTRLFRPNAIITIGSSTGGVDALNTLLSSFPANCPPTVIAQHMPASFLESFSKRLNRNVAPDVAIARDYEMLKPGQIRIAPGGDVDLALMGTSNFRCRLVSRVDTHGHCPSVDVLMKSAAHTAAGNAVGVILTGMGRDGAEGLLALRQSGGRTFAQDEASSTVYGMPKAAWDIGAVETQLPLTHIAATLLNACSRESVRAA